MAEDFVDVRDLYVSCMFKLRHLESPVTCASDCCGLLASNATKVERAGKVIWSWRCTGHAGMVDSQTDSTYIRSVPKEWR